MLIFSSNKILMYMLESKIILQIVDNYDINFGVKIHASLSNQFLLIPTSQYRPIYVIISRTVLKTFSTRSKAW